MTGDTQLTQVASPSVYTATVYFGPAYTPYSIPQPTSNSDGFWYQYTKSGNVVFVQALLSIAPSASLSSAPNGTLTCSMATAPAINASVANTFIQVMSNFPLVMLTGATGGGILNNNPVVQATFLTVPALGGLCVQFFFPSANTATYLSGQQLVTYFSGSPVPADPPNNIVMNFQYTYITT